MDNFEQISYWFDNLKEDDFYWIQVLKRRKDGNSTSSSKQLIKDYTIFNKTVFNECEKEIKDLCKLYNARAYIWVNPRNYKKFQLNLLKTTIDAIDSNSHSVYKLVNKAIANSRSSNYEKLFILDIDTKDRDIVDEYEEIIMKSYCAGNPEWDLIETVNGYHIISHAFNLQLFDQLLTRERLPKIDIHKDNPTLLYYYEI
mgnify:CR=1 FL=1